MRQLASPNILAALYLLLVVAPPAGSCMAQRADNSQIERIRQELVERYAPGRGIIYLTIVPINDIVKQLQDDAQRSRMVNVSDVIISMLIDFRKSQLKPSMSIKEDIAFLKLDLRNKEAIFKLASDSDTSIHTINWSPDQVVLIAELCNRLLDGRHRAAEAREAIKSNRLTVTAALNELDKLRNDPYVSFESTALVLADLRVRVKEKPNELETLRQTDPQVYAVLAQLNSSFDSTVTEAELERLLTTGNSAEVALASSQVTALRSSLDQNFGEAQEALALFKFDIAEDASLRIQTANHFLAQYPQSVKRAEVARRLAVQISELPDPDKRVEGLERLQGLFKELNETSFIDLLLLRAYSQANRPEDALRVGSAYIEKNPDDVVALVQLAVIDQSLIKRLDPPLTRQSLQYGDRAINLIEADRKPANIDAESWNKSKTAWLAKLYQASASIHSLRGESVLAERKSNRAMALYLELGKATSEIY